MEDFRIDLQNPDSPDQPLAGGDVDVVTATAQKLLGGLCTRARIEPDPYVVYGLLRVNDRLGHAEFYNEILLPNPAGGTG